MTESFALELGGGPAITASVAAKLGRKVELATVLGSSALDDFALQELKRRGVGTRCLRRSAQAKKIGGLSVAVSVPRDRYFLTAPGANAEVAAYLGSQALRPALRRAQHVHFGLNPKSWRPFAALLRELRQQGFSSPHLIGAVRQEQEVGVAPVPPEVSTGL